jgi:hypothetical protein
MWYVECRAFQLPGVLAAEVFDRISSEKITLSLNLLELEWRGKLDHPDNGQQYWAKDKCIGRTPKYSKWLTHFDADALAYVSAIYDPAKRGPDQRELIEISFDKSAIAALREVLQNDGTRVAVYDKKAEGDKAWQLESIILTIPSQLPIGNVIAVFRLECELNIKTYEEDCTVTAGRIKTLWPFFYALLDRIGRLLNSRTTNRKMKAVFWSDKYYPFGTPTLQRIPSRNYDLSEDSL